MIRIAAIILAISRSKTWVPKRGSLKSAGKRQENATFLQRSFFDDALQFSVCCSTDSGQNDSHTAEKPMLQCNFCSAAFRKLQRNFRFRLWHVAGVGFRGVGLGLADANDSAITRARFRPSIRSGFWNLVAIIHFSPFTCCFHRFFWRSFTGSFHNENAEFTQSLLCSPFTIYDICSGFR